MRSTNFITKAKRAISILFILYLLNLASVANAQLIFEESFENGISAWNTAPANISYSDNAREGNKSVRFLPVATDKRSELVIKNDLGKFFWGTEYWVGFSLCIVKPTYGFGIICQHHSTPFQWDDVGAGPNSFTIIIADDKTLQIRTSTDTSRVNIIPTSNSASWGTKYVTKPYSLNTWYDFVLHFKYALDTTGYITVWMNGEKVVDIQGPTVYKYDREGRLRTANQYQKIGMYYGDGSQAVAGELLYDAYRIWKGAGGTYQSVAPSPNSGTATSTILDSPEKESFSVFPNPSKGRFFVEFETWGKSQIEYSISSISGEIVKSKVSKSLNSGNHQEQIDLSSQMPGIYFLNISLNGKSSTFKLLKK